jgi:hypothetical protein
VPGLYDFTSSTGEKIMRRFVVVLSTLLVALAVSFGLSSGAAFASVPTRTIDCGGTLGGHTIGTISGTNCDLRGGQSCALVASATTCDISLPNLGLRLRGPLGGSLGLGLGNRGLGNGLGLLPGGLLNFGGFDPALSGLGNQLGSICNFNTFSQLDGAFASRAARDRLRLEQAFGANPALTLQRLRAQQQCQAELQLQGGSLNFSDYGFNQLGNLNVCNTPSFGAFQSFAQPLVGQEWPQVASLFGNGEQDWNANYNQLLAQGCGADVVPQSVPYPVPYSLGGQTPSVVIAPNFNAPSNSGATAGPASVSTPAAVPTPAAAPAPTSNSQVSQIPTAPVQTGDGSTPIG